MNIYFYSSSTADIGRDDKIHEKNYVTKSYATYYFY